MGRAIVMLWVLIASLGAAWSVTAEELPKDAVFEVQYYFSKKDPDLASCDKIMAEAVKEMPQIIIQRICVDDASGRAKLKENEIAVGITRSGDRSLFFGPYFLLSKEDQRDVEEYFAPMMRRLISLTNGKNDFKDRMTPEVAAYVKSIYGKSAKAVMEPDQKGNAIVYYRVIEDGKFEGWIADAYDPISCPVCSSAQFILATDTKGSILNVRPVRPIERLSNKIPDKEIERYCNQFKGKSPTKIPEKEKVDGVARATKSTKAYIEAIHEILETLGKKLKTPEPVKK